MISGTYDTISEAWFATVKEIYRNGNVMDTEYGMKAKYANGMLLEIKNPAIAWHKKDPFCSPMRVKFYQEQFKRASIGQHGFEYTYVDRMVNYPGKAWYDVLNEELGDDKVDQLEWMRKQLLAHRYESRRIQCITWIPEIDCKREEDQPCFQRMWIFPHKNNQLDIHIHYRSWDMFKAFEANLMGFQQLVKDELTEPTDFTLGTLRCFGDNVHLYEDDWQAIEAII